MKRLIISNEIRRLVEEGWTLTSQTNVTAGMSRDGLVIFLELQNDETVRISGNGKEAAEEELSDGTVVIGSTVGALITPDPENTVLRWTKNIFQWGKSILKSILRGYFRAWVRTGWAGWITVIVVLLALGGGQVLGGGRVIIVVLIAIVLGALLSRTYFASRIKQIKKSYFSRLF